MKTYHCLKCDICFERPFRREPWPCPGCESYQNEAMDVPTLIVYGNPTTVGQAAEENAKRVGKEEIQRMTRESKDKRTKVLKMPKGASRIPVSPDVPWFRSGETPGLPKMSKPLNIKKVKDQKKYVETGETT